MCDPNEQVDWDATADEEVKEYFESLLPDDDADSSDDSDDDSDD